MPNSLPNYIPPPREPIDTNWLADYITDTHDLVSGADIGLSPRFLAGLNILNMIIETGKRQEPPATVEEVLDQLTVEAVTDVRIAIRRGNVSSHASNEGLRRKAAIVLEYTGLTD